MSRAYLSLGSNVDAERHIRAALAALRARFAGCRISTIYRSRAVGFEGDDFINLAAVIETRLSPRALRDWLRALEHRHGRDRSQPRYSDRTLDIDILLFDDPSLSDEELDLPRREILRFAHVLKPLADLAPDLVHPTEHRTMAELWASADMDRQALVAIELPGLE